MKANHYVVSTFIAQQEGIPREFIAIPLRETVKAVQLFGHGTVGNLVTCCNCGRNLTHPVSRLVGIGPECGRHYWDENALGPYGFTEEHTEQLKKMVHKRVVSLWMPKSLIKKVTAVEEEIEPPQEEHHGTGNENISDHRQGDSAGKGDDRNAPSGRENSRGDWDAHSIGNENSDSTNPERLKRRLGRTAALSSDRDAIEVRFPYNPADIARARTLPSRRWNPDNKQDKHWTCAVRVDSVRMLLDWDFTILPGLWDWYDLTVSPSAPGKAEVGFDSELAKMFPFQKEGVLQIEKLGGRALIGDEMGLGKTVQALAYLERKEKTPKTVVVCPASVKINWAREVEKWTSITAVQILSGKKAFTPSADLVIINYDILGTWIDELKKMEPEVVIIDECHYAKNTKAQRTKAVLKLCKGVPHVLAMSGTPITNRPVEILNSVQIIAPGLFPKRWDFLMRYCGAKHNGFGWDFNGATNMEELHKILTESCLIRRLKKDVLKELPPKIRSVVPLEIDNRDEYDAIENATKDIVQKSLDKIEGTQIANAEALAKIEYLKQAAVRGKMKAAVAWIRNWLDSGEKLVVFCHHKTTVDALMKEFGECAVKIDGSVPTAPSTKRQEAVDTFQNETWCRLFVGTMAAKEGITLTAASNTCFLEMWWTSGDHVQAEDRVHRIGQEADSVGAYYLIGERTIEETIAKLIDKKAKVLAAVLDGKSVENENLLTALLREYKKTVKIGEVTV